MTNALSQKIVKNEHLIKWSGVEWNRSIVEISMMHGGGDESTVDDWKWYIIESSKMQHFKFTLSITSSFPFFQFVISTTEAAHQKDRDL